MLLTLHYFLLPSCSYLATTWLFVTWNTVCITLSLHSALVPHNVYSIKSLVAAALAFRHYKMAGRDIGFIASSSLEDKGISAIALSAADSEGVPLVVKAFISASGVDAFAGASFDDLAAACDDDDASGLLKLRASSIQSCFGLSKSRVLSVIFSLSSARRWYIASIFVLFAYIGVNVSLSSSNPDSGRYLCLITAASVVLIDICVAFMWRGSLLQSTRVVSLVSAAARIALIAFGGNYWLLGQCTVYAIIGIYLSHVLVMQRFSTGEKIVSLKALFEFGIHRRSELSNHLSGGPPAAAAASATPSLSACQPRLWITNTFHFAFHPGGLLMLTTLIFTVFVMGLAISMERNTSTIPNTQVPTIQGRIPQYAFGVGALCVVAVWLCSELTLGLWRRGKRSFDSVGWAFAGISWAICGSLGGVLGWLTSSWAILACGVFIPPLCVALMYGYGRWLADDYVCLLPGGLELRKLFSGAIMSASFVALPANVRRNWFMLFSVIAVCASLCGFGATISGTVSRIIHSVSIYVSMSCLFLWHCSLQSLSLTGRS